MDNEKIPFTTKIKSFGIKCVRVWHVLKKPTKQEFQNIAKISAIGIAIVGVLGFLVSMVMVLFKPLF